MTWAVRAFVESQRQETARDLSSLGSPLVLTLIVALTEREAWLGVLLGLVAIEALGRLIKLLRFTDRPLPSRYESWLEKSDAGSFPSIHAARSAFVFLTLFIASNDGLARALYVVLPVAVGGSRIVLARHRWVDVTAGWALGMLGAWILQWVTT